MLTRTILRALSPGPWARVRVPDYECWQKAEGYSRPMAGQEVDVCVIPCYGPRYDSEKAFHWNYRTAYRNPGGSSWSNYYSPDGSMLAPWDFGLIDASTDSPSWDKETCDEHYQGKGKWLYEPASDDPALCPGGDWSRYLCSTCQKYVRPFSNDEGELTCPFCEATGLVILDEEQLARLEQVREFARSMGLSEQLERQLHYLAGNRDGRQCVLGYDFAPHSFAFANYVLPSHTANGQRHFSYNGGLIYQGPTSPADGSFPSLTVSLASGTGWFAHT